MDAGLSSTAVAVQGSLPANDEASQAGRAACRESRSQPEPWDAGRFLRIGLALELGLVGVGALIGFLSGRGPFPFRLAGDANAWLVGLAATAPLLVLAYLLTKGPLGRLPAFAHIHERVKAVLEVPLRGLGPWGIALISAAAGIGEEVLFRGVLQDLLGIVLASIIFGLLHALTPTYFALATALGAYLGWLLIETGNLLPPMIVHALYDFVALSLMKQQFAEEAREPRTRADQDQDQDQDQGELEREDEGKGESKGEGKGDNKGPSASAEPASAADPLFPGGNPEPDRDAQKG